MPVLGFALMLVGAVIGHFLKRFMKHKTPERIGTFHHICAINNYVFLPIIILQSIWGDRHVALLLLMNVGSTVGFWTIGVMTFTGGGTVGQTLRSIFSINVAAVAAALLVCFLRIPIPEPIAYTCKYLGDITVPFMLVIIGVALVNCFKSMLKHKTDMVYLSLVRLAVIPVVLLLLLKLLPLPPDVYQTAAVVALMPAASSSVLVARQYGGDYEFAGQAIIVTTILSLATIPLLIMFMFSSRLYIAPLNAATPVGNGRCRLWPGATEPVRGRWSDRWCPACGRAGWGGRSSSSR